MIFRLKIIFSAFAILLFFNLVPVFGDVKLDGVTFTRDNINWSFGNNISLSSIILQSDGIILQADESSEPRKYNFISNQQLDVTLVNLTNDNAKFSINTPNLTDAKLTISGSKLTSVTSDGQPTDSWTWTGVENSVNVGSGGSIDVSFPDNANAIQGGTGSGGKSYPPPTFLGPPYSTTYPFSIDGTGFYLPNYSNTVETKTLFVGKPVVLKLSLNSFDSLPLTHLGLYTNIRDGTNEIQDSDTYLVYDKGSTLDVHDPHGYFSKVNFTTNVNATEFTFLITFSKPMEKSDLLVRSWDSHRNSADVKILNLWQVVNSSNETMLQKPDLLSVENKTSPIDIQNADLILQIKEWGGYSSKSISDSELLANLGINARHIPSWFMKTTPWVLDNEITLEEFVNAIRYMHENQIIA